MFKNDSSVEIKLLVIGFFDYFDRIKKSLLKFPNLVPTFIAITSYEQFEVYLKDLSLDYEIILLTDIKLMRIFQRSIKNYYEYNLHIFPTNELSIIDIYLQSSLANTISSFSTDCLLASTKQHIEELNLPTKSFLYSFEDRDINELVKLHTLNFTQENATIITSSPVVKKILLEKGISSNLALPHSSEISITLERSILSSPTRKSRESQPVVIIFEFEKINSIIQPFVSKELNSYKKILNGVVYKIDRDTYHLITDLGRFENVSNGYKKIHLLDNFNAIKDVTIKIGIGFGKTHSISLYNANIAIKQAKERKGDTCFIAREDKSIIGPLEPNLEPNYEKYNVSIPDSTLINMANEFQMSAVYLSKLLSRLQAEKKFTYTSEELAITLNMTTRSANRILLKLLDAGLISIIGEEKVNSNGRPRRLYNFTFLKDLDTT